MTSIENTLLCMGFKAGKPLIGFFKHPSKGHQNTNTAV